MYPSPLGRALGATGTLPYLNVAACVALPAVAIILTRRNKGNVLIAAIACSFAPLAWVGAYASVDMTAASLLLLSLVVKPHHRTLAMAVGFTAVLLHWALLPFTLLIFFGRRSYVALGCILALVLPVAFYTWLTTDYGEASGKFVAHKALTGFVGTFLLVGALSVFPLWPILRQRALALAFLTVAAAEAGMQNHVHIRYGLPVLAFTAASLCPWRYSLTRMQRRAHKMRYAQGGVTNSRLSPESWTEL